MRFDALEKRDSAFARLKISSARFLSSRLSHASLHLKATFVILETQLMIIIDNN